jgi:hypothetical protein
MTAAEPDWMADQFTFTEGAPAPTPIRRASHLAALRAVPWRELMATAPEPPPVLRPGVPEVGVTVLAGAPKVGKTLIACQWALECGRPALLVIEEGSLAGVTYRLSRQAAGLRIAEPDVHLLHRQGIRLDDRSSVDRLRAVVHELHPALVVLDPLNRLHGAEENSPSQMTVVMNALASLAYDCGTAILAVHHLAKPSAERRGDVWDRLRGGGSIRSGTDANLAMDGKGGHVKLVGEFRDHEPLMEDLELHRETLLFRPAEAPKAPSKLDATALRAWVEERRQVTAREVMKEFSVSKVTALNALRGLGCDEYSGPRGLLTFTLRAVQ